MKLGRFLAHDQTNPFPSVDFLKTSTGEHLLFLNLPRYQTASQSLLGKVANWPGLIGDNLESALDRTDYSPFAIHVGKLDIKVTLCSGPG